MALTMREDKYTGPVNIPIKFYLMVSLAGAVLLSSASAQEILLHEGQTNALPGTFTVPFAFYSGTLGPSIGASIGSQNKAAPTDTAASVVVP